MAAAAEQQPKEGRRLQAGGSNPEAPQRKYGKGGGKPEPEDMPVDDNGEVEEIDSQNQMVQSEAVQEGGSVANMLATILQDLKEIKQNQAKEQKKAKQDKEEIQAEIQEVARKAERAAEEASQAKEATSVLKVEMEKMKKGVGFQEAAQKAVEEVLAGKGAGSSSWTSEAEWPILGPKGGGKGKGVGGKSAETKERQSRTLTFGAFPDGTKADAINNFMSATLGEETLGETEEVYAYGKRYATRGGVRFKSSKDMWKYMEKHAGGHQHEFNGHKVYVNVHDGARPAGEVDQAKAVRKMTRAIIEEIGGDPQEVKLDMQPSYGRGPFKYQGKHVAEWKDGEMKILADGKPFAARFRTLMGKE